MEREREKMVLGEEGVCVCVCVLQSFIGLGIGSPKLIGIHPFSPLGPYNIMFSGWALTPIVKPLRLISVAAPIGTLASTPCVKWASISQVNTLSVLGISNCITLL